MSEDRVVEFLRELSGKLWKISRKLDELSRDIESFIDTYEDAYGEYSGEDWEDYDYIYECLDCHHQYEESGPCPKCGSEDRIPVERE
jgi:rubrerythrin